MIGAIVAFVLVFAFGIGPAIACMIVDARRRRKSTTK